MPIFTLALVLHFGHGPWPAPVLYSLRHYTEGHGPCSAPGCTYFQPRTFLFVFLSLYWRTWTLVSIGVYSLPRTFYLYSFPYTEGHGPWSAPGCILYHGPPAGLRHLLSRRSISKEHVNNLNCSSFLIDEIKEAESVSDTNSWILSCGFADLSITYWRRRNKLSFGSL